MSVPPKALPPEALTKAVCVSDKSTSENAMTPESVSVLEGVMPTSSRAVPMRSAEVTTTPSLLPTSVKVNVPTLNVPFDILIVYWIDWVSDSPTANALACPDRALAST